MSFDNIELSNESNGNNAISFRAYCICRVDDGVFLNSPLIDLEVAEAAIAQMSERQRVTSVLVPINLVVPMAEIIEFMAAETEKRKAIQASVRLSN